MFDRVNLNEIEIGQMTLIKERYVWHDRQDHSRWVFKLKKGNAFNCGNELFVKIWNPSYVRRDNILKAIDAGFYDESTTPALKYLIYHKGLCRGYAMDKCDTVYSLKLDEEFFEIIKEKSRKSGFFNAQFSPCHVMKYKKLFSIIDLESVFPISDLTIIHKQRAFFDYEAYENFIVNEYNNLNVGVRQKFSENMKNKNYFRDINQLFRFPQTICRQIVNSLTVVDGKYISMIEH